MLEFLLGLTIGLTIWGWYYFPLNQQLRRLLKELSPELMTVALPLTSRITQAVTAQHRRQEELQKQIEADRQILQHAPIAFLEVDEENRLLWCNQQAYQLLAIPTREHTYPRLLLELVRSYELDNLIEETRERQQPAQGEWVFQPTHAELAELSRQSSHALRAHSLPLLNGHVAVFLEDRQDILQLTRQRDRAFSDVAHEIRTPLTSIRLVAETLQGQLTPPLRQWVDRLLKEVIRLSNLVQDLLDLSRMERGAVQLNRSPVDLCELIQSAWLSIEPIAREKSIHLQFQGPPHCFFMADQARLYRVFTNLLDNSIKYSPPEQDVQVILQQLTSEAVKGTDDPSHTRPNPRGVNAIEPDSTKPNYVVIDVIDAGAGFPEESLPFIFERFYRADPSRTRPPETEASLSPSLDETSGGLPGGSGLGLAIVRQLIEAHQGSVRAQNHPQTGGAWVQICLPIVGS